MTELSANELKEIARAKTHEYFEKMTFVMGSKPTTIRDSNGGIGGVVGEARMWRTPEFILEIDAKYDLKGNVTYTLLVDNYQKSINLFLYSSTEEIPDIELMKAFRCYKDATTVKTGP